MTHAVKGALLSGAVFPGLGQIALKRYRRGVVLMAVVLAGMVVMVARAVRVALAVLDTMASEGGVPDQEAISGAVARAAALSGSSTLDIPLLVILIFWIYGTLDAYRLGKQLDLNGPNTGESDIKKSRS